MCYPAVMRRQKIYHAVNTNLATQTMLIYISNFIRLHFVSDKVGPVFSCHSRPKLGICALKDREVSRTEKCHLRHHYDLISRQLELFDRLAEYNLGESVGVNLAISYVREVNP